MKLLTNILMKGLATVLPIGLTIYAIWWLISSAESVMHALIHLLAPQVDYRPGMGILAGLLVLLVVGTLLNAYIVRRALSLWDDLLSRIPVVKTVYSAFRDIMRLLPSGENQKDLQSVVVYQFGNARLLGFVTRDDLPELERHAGGVDLVAVYFPLSYMMGGVTLFLPKDALQALDMPVEAAMRLAITGGMASTSPTAPASR
ncbi:MAG: DUF502 domain-containing protein [Pseudomonadota bacterium]|jgi:hypothetical protein